MEDVSPVKLMRSQEPRSSVEASVMEVERRGLVGIRTQHFYNAVWFTLSVSTDTPSNR